MKMLHKSSKTDVGGERQKNKDEQNKYGGRQLKQRSHRA